MRIVSPIVACLAYCDEDASKAEEYSKRYIGGYYGSVLKHYEMLGGHFKGTKGYEYYDKMSGNLVKHGLEGTGEWYASLQVYGTPDECVERAAIISQNTGCSEMLFHFSYSGMPYDDALASLRTFNAKVQPRLKLMTSTASAPGGRPAPADDGLPLPVV